MPTVSTGLEVQALATGLEHPRTVDARVHPQRPDLVARAIKPDYGLSSHVAPLGLLFSAGQHLGTTRRRRCWKHCMARECNPAGNLTPRQSSPTLTRVC